MRLLDERDVRHTELYDLAWKLARGHGPMMASEEIDRFHELVKARESGVALPQASRSERRR